MIPTILVAGGLGVMVAWRLVARRSVSVWVGQGAVLGAVGLAALSTGRVNLSPRVWWGWALLAGAAAGVVLYLGTLGFVRSVRMWRTFERHTSAIYGHRRGLPLPVALALAVGVAAPGEELFWRGLFQSWLATPVGRFSAAVLTWGCYVCANAASGSLPILAGAVVGGAAWGALALWTRGALASIACHAVWTTLMVILPPRAHGSGRV